LLIEQSWGAAAGPTRSPFLARKLFKHGDDAAATAHTHLVTRSSSRGSTATELIRWLA
jgi:hypothetical protein